MKILIYTTQFAFTALGVLLLSGYRPVSQEILIALLLVSGTVASMLFFLYSKNQKEVIPVEKVRSAETEESQDASSTEDFLKNFKQHIQKENLNEGGIKKAFDHLVKAMQAGQALFHEVDTNENGTPVLKIKYTFAYFNPEKKQEEIAFGDGLLGAAAQENTVLKLADFPVQYLNAKSGLGESKTFSLIIIPVSIDAKVKAVIEVGSFIKAEDLSDKDLEEIAEIFADLMQNTTSEIQKEKENVEEY